MANPTTTSNVVSNLLSTHRALLDTLTSFLTVTTHHILYLRRLYPPASFLSARAYNFPVRQNRHPTVCAWINDAITAIRDQLEKNTVEKVTLCIYECDDNRVLERWTFDLRSFPSVTKRERDVPFESNESNESEDVNQLERKVNLVDLEANFRATLSRITTSAARLRPFPEGLGAPECSFTMTIEVKDKADRPVGRIEKEERKWIAAEPETFLTTTPSSHKNTAQAEQALPQTHSIRRLEAGELRMEVWVEEAAAKFEFDVPESVPGSSLPPEERAARMSYGAGREKFDPGNLYPYDLEPPDVNRKPQGGAATDYQRG